MLFIMFPYVYIAYLMSLDCCNRATVLESFPRDSMQQQLRQYPQDQQEYCQLLAKNLTNAILSLQALEREMSGSIEQVSSPQAPSCPPQPPAAVGVGCRLALGLQTQKPADFESFEQVLNKATSDKKLHNYGHAYAEYFDPIKYDKIAFLEIGLQGGDSITLWKNFFPNAFIYGLDKGEIYQGFRQHEGSENLKIFVGDQANVTFLRQMKEVIQKEVGSLEFIIDDGGHTMQQQQTSLVELLPIVKPGGYYFIEDLETSYYEKCTFGCWGCCGGGPPGKNGTTVNVLKGMLDVLNEDFIPGENPKHKFGVYRHKVIEGDHLVESMQCWRNMCVLRKKKDSKL